MQLLAGILGDAGADPELLVGARFLLLVNSEQYFSCPRQKMLNLPREVIWWTLKM